MIARESVFRPDGTVKGLRYAVASTTRGDVLIASLGSRKTPNKLLTSFSVVGVDFNLIYDSVIRLIADYHGLAKDAPMVSEMLNSRDAFLKAYGLTTTPVCYQQLTRKEENEDID